MESSDIFRAVDSLFDMRYTWVKINCIIFLITAVIALVRGLYSTDDSKEWDDDLKNL